MSEGLHLLDSLEQALNEEREALLEQDVDRLLASNQAKLTALQEIEKVELDPGLADRVGDLLEKNRANKALLSRRRHEVRWSLQHLGMTDSGTIYQQDGTNKANTSLRYFGAG